MVQTNSHRFNTHVKHLSLSASVVIIIIKRLLATRRIITQYFNHLPVHSKLMSHYQLSKIVSEYDQEIPPFGDFAILGDFAICK